MCVYDHNGEVRCYMCSTQKMAPLLREGGDMVKKITRRNTRILTQSRRKRRKPITAICSVAHKGYVHCRFWRAGVVAFTGTMEELKDSAFDMWFRPQPKKNLRGFNGGAVHCKPTLHALLYYNESCEIVKDISHWKCASGVHFNAGLTGQQIMWQYIYQPENLEFSGKVWKYQGNVREF